MTITPGEYRAKIERAFGNEVLKAMMMGVGDAYRTTPEHCKRNYDPPDRQDIMGHVRRARVHEAIRGVAERFSLDFADLPNVNGSSSFLSIVSGEIRLICCLIATKKSMVRPAKIRKLLASHNFDDQPSLFPSSEPKPGAPLMHLAILVHPRAGRRRDEPAFVDIVIPDRSFSRYMDRVELFGMFPKEATAYRNQFTRKRRRSEAEGA